MKIAILLLIFNVLGTDLEIYAGAFDTLQNCETYVTQAQPKFKSKMVCKEDTTVGIKR